jgi:transposase
LKPIDRQQMLLRPVVVEALIAEDHPARAIWAFVGQLDLSRYRAPIRSVEGSAGRPALDPHLRVSLWVYSYRRGVSSARAIERLCDSDPASQWLTGLEGISGHTLSDFRVAHADALRDLFVQVLALLSAEGLITLERVTQDGTRIRACAAAKRFRRKPRIEAYLAQAREAVAALDAQTEEESSLQIPRAQARAKREQLERLEAALKEFEKLAAAHSTADRVSTTDPEARVMTQADGGYAPHDNVQISTAAAHGLIVDIAVTQAGSDSQQLTPALDRLERTVQRVPTQVVVDGGYISHDHIAAMAHRGIDLVGPAPEDDAAQSHRRKSYQHRGVSADDEAPMFVYDPATNTYGCPQGKRLWDDANSERNRTVSYRYKAEAHDCSTCPAKALCCPRTRCGRSIERREPVPEIGAVRQKMQTDDARAIYRTRSQVAEFPNLWIKAKLGLRQFRGRGLTNVGSESLWAALTDDIQQWIRLRWRPHRVAARAGA